MSKELKYAKSLWSTIDHNWSDTSIVNGETTICRFDLSDCYDEDGNPTDSLELVEANIKLVASAPELLEALIKVKIDLKEIRDHISHSEYLTNILDEIETKSDHAIDKATL